MTVAQFNFQIIWFSVSIFLYDDILSDMSNRIYIMVKYVVYMFKFLNNHKRNIPI